MTEISTNDDINNQTPHLSQPLQNSPRHFHQRPPYQFHPHPNSPQQHYQSNSNSHQYHILNFNNHLINISHNDQNNEKTLSLNSSANIQSNTSTPPSSALHSPQHHYCKPLNSPNSSAPYAHQTIYAANHLRHNKLPSQYQQHLNDILLQQQHLQNQQQQLLLSEDQAVSAGGNKELSEESLKRNVAIVLNNLDRYNTALRSIILNEEISSCSNSLFLQDCYDSLLLEKGKAVANNNNNQNMATATTPQSDYNSNATTPASRSNMLPHDTMNLLQQQQQQGQPMVGFVGVGLNNGGGSGGGGVLCPLGNNLNSSVASSMHDFTHDNSDYQWFLDYGYRDGCAGMQRSVLSSLSASYNGLGDLIYYDDLAKNIDANLAEVDMESFRAEDIHSLLSQLPSYCKSLGGNCHNRLQQSLAAMQQHQMFSPLSESTTAQHSPLHNICQTSTTSTNELIDNSICKSELLFSPVKESHISVDSLDLDAYPDEGDIILTCKANKDNYTIAFEGSVLYSDDSFYAEPHENVLRQQNNKQNFINLHSNLEDIVKPKTLDMCMTRSEQIAAADSLRNKLQKSFTTQQLQSLSFLISSTPHRYPSGNNNTCNALCQAAVQNISSPSKSVRKSSSLPNLHQNIEEEEAQSQHQMALVEQELLQQLNVSQALNNSTAGPMRNLLPMCQIPMSCNSNCGQLPPQQHHQHLRHKHRCCNNSSHNQQLMNSNCKHSTHLAGSASSGSSNPPAFNLVKMFIKQKSSQSSSEFADAAVSSHTCMDVSSGCWPSSDAAGSSSSSSLEQRLRKKSMNDSGKGSALSRHDEEDDDCAFEMTTNSPAHKRRSMPLRHPQVSHLSSTAAAASSLLSSDGSRSNSEPLTQVSLRSSARTKTRLESASKSTTSTEQITRSMQTSCGTMSTRSSLSERFLRCVPPSFLEKLNNLGEERQAPIYVIYPSYALPDLGFVKTHSASADVIFSPFSYKTAMGLGSSSAALGNSGSIKKRLSFAENEDEILKNINYKHVMDWTSLATLLPVEYRKRLKHIPEVRDLDDGDLAQKPLFCMTPPARRCKTNICDCAQFVQQQQQTNLTEEASSSSGSSQQPSSGYRGSSTLLTDSELGLENSDPLKQMYVYQYERSEAVPERPAAPQPMPRGILRKSNSASNRHKRSSMIEEQQQTKLSKLEKRRSLQEPPYAHTAAGFSEEFLAQVFEEEPLDILHPVPKTRKERLSRKDLDARARAENFLSSLPRSELKYYAEIAAILESSEDLVHYDAVALKKEVSRVLSQQKKVSFNDEEDGQNPQQHQQLLNVSKQQRFSTPPNSPNISMATVNAARNPNHPRPTLDAKAKEKQDSNRFKRLQIQWELISKDSSMLKELANEQQTKSGGSTPTSANGGHINKSRIPRPVSYPAGKITKQDANGKITTRSPSRIVPPKRYSMTSPSTATAGTAASAARARTPTTRTAVTAPNTPSKKCVPAPRTVNRVR